MIAVWTCILASKDQDGITKLTPRAIKLLWADSLEPRSLEEIEHAWSYLCSPDPQSGNPDHAGRRLVPTGDGRWQVVSHEKYRDRHSGAAYRAAATERQRRRRDKLKQSAEVDRDQAGDSGLSGMVHASQPLTCSPSVGEANRTTAPGTRSTSALLEESRGQAVRPEVRAEEGPAGAGLLQAVPCRADAADEAEVSGADGGAKAPRQRQELRQQLPTQGDLEAATVRALRQWQSPEAPPGLQSAAAGAVGHRESDAGIGAAGTQDQPPLPSAPSYTPTLEYPTYELRRAANLEAHELCGYLEQYVGRSSMAIFAEAADYPGAGRMVSRADTCSPARLERTLVTLQAWRVKVDALRYAGRPVDTETAWKARPRVGQAGPAVAPRNSQTSAWDEAEERLRAQISGGRDVGRGDDAKGLDPGAPGGAVVPRRA